MSSSLYVEGSKTLMDKNTLKICENPDQGILNLFSQNYTETNSVPNNIFIAKLQGNKIYDKLYSAIYGTLKSEISLITSKALNYKTARDSCLFPFPILYFFPTFITGIFIFYNYYLIPKSIRIKAFLR